MVESDGLDNSYEESINDEVALMSKKFKQMMIKKGKFWHSSKRKTQDSKRNTRKKTTRSSTLNVESMNIWRLSVPS